MNPGDASDPDVSHADRLRQRILRAMQTVRSIRVRSDDEVGQSLAMMLLQLLHEMMDELDRSTDLPIRGSRRGREGF
jgi:hypothetical protein